MKLLSIIVDEFPKSCGNCPLMNDNYCMVKGCSIESNQSWIDRHSETRDAECPLKIQKTTITKGVDNHG